MLSKLCSVGRIVAHLLTLAHMQPSSTRLRAIMLMVGAMAFFAVMNTAIRALAGHMGSMQMVFLRSVLSLIFITALMLRQHGVVRAPFATTRFKGHMWRSTLGLAAMEVWFYSLTLLPITLATALSFTTPVFVTLFALAFFGERAGWRRWMAITASFIGVLIILRPGLGVVQPSALLVLLSSALMALAAVAVKTLSRNEPPERIVFYMSLIITPLSLPFALLHWVEFGWQDIGLLLIIAYFSTMAQLWMARAYQLADMVTLMPFDFTRLLFVAILGYVFFGEVLDGRSWLGAGVIVASTVYIVYREQVAARRNTSP